MSANALSLSQNEPAGKAVRLPPLPGRQQGAAHVDVESHAFKAGQDSALTAMREELAEQQARHEDFALSVGAMLADMDARYRKDCLALIERLFAAVAPSLAVRSSLADIMQIVEERALREQSELTLRVHPSLVAHLCDADQRKLSATPLVTLNTDETCAPAMVDAEWRNGGLFHDPDELIREILQALGDEPAPLVENGNE